MTNPAIQDFYAESTSYCYGCGRLNPAGLHIKSRWEGDESVCHFTPRPEHMAIPGYVYGGLIASLIDCHGTGTAAAAKYREEERAWTSEPDVRCVTGSLHVDYLKPTPLGPVLELRGVVTEIKGRKITVEITVFAGGEITATGRVVAIQVPAGFMDAK